MAMDDVLTKGGYRPYTDLAGVKLEVVKLALLKFQKKEGFLKTHALSEVILFGLWALQKHPALYKEFCRDRLD